MKYFIQHDTVYIYSLGDCEDFDEADQRADKLNPPTEGPSWIMDENSLRELKANIEEVLK